MIASLPVSATERSTTVWDADACEVIALLSDIRSENAAEDLREDVSSEEMARQALCASSCNFDMYVFCRQIVASLLSIS